MLSVKYERAMFDGQVREVLSEPICLGIAERYQMTILAFGTDRDNVHSLVQPVPTQRIETPESGDRYPAPARKRMLRLGMLPSALCPEHDFSRRNQLSAVRVLRIV